MQRLPDVDESSSRHDGEGAEPVSANRALTSTGAIEKLPVPVGKIVPDHSNQIHRPEKAGRHGGIRGRPAEQLVVLRGGGLDVIERDGTDNEDRHIFLGMSPQVTHKLVPRSSRDLVASCENSPKVT